MTYPPLRRASAEPSWTDPDDERRHRKRQCAIAYRVFGALRWGQAGDGHISARDPVRTDHFWLLRYGVPFDQATVDDLVLVAPDGSVAEGPDVEGGAEINTTAYYIHMPIHEARPEVVGVAHTHTAHGTPWSSAMTPFEAVSQEACSFVFNQSIFDGEELNVMDYATGRRIAVAMGSSRLCFLRNHGLLTAGGSVAEAVGFFVMAERVAEVHIKVPQAVPISDEGAKRVADWADKPEVGWESFQYLCRTLVPDPSVVG